MTEYSEALELEHRGSQLRLDIRNLTVVADTLAGRWKTQENVDDAQHSNPKGRAIESFVRHRAPIWVNVACRHPLKTYFSGLLDDPVPLFRMGSGENWVGYHVLAHLALHKWFRQKNRPVPGFIIFDQPSQAHYPPERDADGSLDVLSDEDQTAVLQLFKLISDAASELAPHLQIIVMDHADLKRVWFENAVVERWHGGKCLIPQNWIVWFVGARAQLPSTGGAQPCSPSVRRVGSVPATSRANLGRHQGLTPPAPAFTAFRSSRWARWRRDWPDGIDRSGLVLDILRVLEKGPDPPLDNGDRLRDVAGRQSRTTRRQTVEQRAAPAIAGDTREYQVEHRKRPLRVGAFDPRYERI
jgi:uncharacterized protein DUF3732